MITDDIATIKKNEAPSFGSASNDTYRTWEPHPQIALKVIPFEKEKRLEFVSKDGALNLGVKAGTAVRFEIESTEDLDTFAEYLQDKEDASRLPKKIREEKELDLVSIEWTCDGGSFSEGKQPKSKVGQAPQQPGTYRVLLRVDDFGLVRPPDKGFKKDQTKDLSLIIIVTE
jgi:hypothetical protein